MQFTKIRVTDRGVDIMWNTAAKKAPESTIEHQLKSKELPHPDFVAALQALKPDVLKLLELPAKYGEGLTVTGIRLTHVKDRLGLVVTSQRKLERSNSPLNLHTPHLQEASDEDADGAWLSDELVALVESVKEHAQLYIDGTRAQAELPLAGAEK